jgi:geranylgeranyl pyrophosphate synthase
VCGILACGTCAPRHSSLVRQCTRCSNKAPLLEEEEEVEDKIEIKQEQEEGESFEKAVESIAKKESYTKSIDRAYLAKTKQMIRDLKNNRVGSLDLKRYERSVQKKMSY